MEEYTRRVQYYETDKMSFVHHSNHIRWFEEARLDYMDKIGIPYKMLEDMGYLCPVLSAECKYRKSIHFNDTVKILTKLTYMDNVRLFFSYQIIDAEDGTLLTTGKTEHCFLNSNGRVITLKKHNPEIFEKIMSNVEDEIFPNAKRTASTDKK